MYSALSLQIQQTVYRVTWEVCEETTEWRKAVSMEPLLCFLWRCSGQQILFVQDREKEKQERLRIISLGVYSIQQPFPVCIQMWLLPLFYEIWEPNLTKQTNVNVLLTANKKLFSHYLAKPLKLLNQASQLVINYKICHFSNQKYSKMLLGICEEKKKPNKQKQKNRSLRVSRNLIKVYQRCI